jgi:hypothetical protein
MRKEAIQDALAIVQAQLRGDAAGAETIVNARGGPDLELVAILAVTAVLLAKSLAACRGDQTAEEHLRQVALEVASWPDDREDDSDEQT